MLVGQFIKVMETTKETIRYYIEEGLLTPEKINTNYFFGEKDRNDFENIRELREMGLPIRVIKEIKQNQNQCGTTQQWQDNLVIVEEELDKTTKEIQKLIKQKEALMSIKEELEQLL